MSENAGSDEIFDLMHKDRYSVAELAELLNCSPHRIEDSVFAGDLPAEIVNHQIVSISRSDAIAWMNSPSGQL